MFEEFGGRDADPQDAYLGEVETSQIYLGILGRRYGRPLPTRFSATHAEFRHAEQQGLRVAVWALDTPEREGPQQAFLDEVRAFHVAPAFGSPADLQRQVGARLRGIAAEDLAPWTKLGCILFRASEVTHEGNRIAVTARVQSDDVAHALETLAPDDFGGQGEHRFTWSGTLNTSFVERLNLTIRQGSASLRRRSRCHARGADQLHGHVDLLRCYDNVIRPHRALKFGRETRTPAMQAGLVNAPMNWSDIFTAPAALYAFPVAVVRVPGAVQLMHTSPAALSSFSWPHEHRSAA